MTSSMKKHGRKSDIHMDDEEVKVRAQRFSTVWDYFNKFSDMFMKMRELDGMTEGHLIKMENVRKGPLPKQLLMVGTDEKEATNYNDAEDITSIRKLVKESQIKIKDALKDLDKISNELDALEKKIPTESDIEI